jgi:hypothetical protein
VTGLIARDGNLATRSPDGRPVLRVLDGGSVRASKPGRLGPSAPLADPAPLTPSAPLAPPPLVPPPIALPTPPSQPANTSAPIAPLGERHREAAIRRQPAGRTATGPSPVRRGLVATAVAAVEEWLLEPAGSLDEAAPPSPPRLRPVVAVFGLASGCGATVVARALATELAARDPDGVAAVSCDDRVSGLPVASGGAVRLARVLADLPGAETRALGRLCLVTGTEALALADTARHHAPLVIDAGSASIGGAPASVADHVVLVAAPELEPALAAVAARCVERVGPEPIVVLTRARAERDERSSQNGWSTRAAVSLPESRVAARLALAGRESHGRFGQAVRRLGDLCEGRW